MPEGVKAYSVLLACDAIFALFVGTHPSHTYIVDELTYFSEHGFEPLFPFPALVGFHNESFVATNRELQGHVNIVMSHVARSPLLTMPVPEDVETSSSLANLALIKDLEISFLDTTILAMARRMGALILTDDIQLFEFASSLELEASSETMKL